MRRHHPLSRPSDEQLFARDSFCYHDLAKLEHSKPADVTEDLGVVPEAAYPAASPAQYDRSGVEPPLGYAIDDMPVVGEPAEVAAAAAILADRAAAPNPFAGKTDVDLRAEYDQAMSVLRFPRGQDNGKWTEATQDAENRRVGIEREMARRASLVQKPVSTANPPRSLAEMTNDQLDFCIRRAAADQLRTFDGTEAERLQEIIDDARAELERRQTMKDPRR